MLPPSFSVSTATGSSKEANGGFLNLPEGWKSFKTVTIRTSNLQSKSMGRALAIQHCRSPVHLLMYQGLNQADML
jgi:hypothetical protein